MTKEITKYTGWRENLPNAEYHNGPGYSSTDLRLVLKSGAHLKCKDSYEETAAQLEGSAAHSLVLDDVQTFNREFNVVDGKRSAKMKKEAAEEGVSLLSPSQGANIHAWANAIKEHTEANNLMQFKGATEVSGYWIDPATGLLCKVRTDKLIPSLSMIVDLKFMSVRDSVDLGYKFQAAIVNYRYDIQAAYYLQGANAIDQDLHYDTFVWVVCAKEKPHMVGVYLADAEILASGAQGSFEALAKIKECEDTGVWPKPFTGGINKITFPHWHKTKKGEQIYE